MAEVFFSGAWRTPNRGEILIGGAWRTITRGEQYRSGAWKQIVTFASPLSVSAGDVFGRTTNRKPIQVTSTDSLATPVGGIAPFTYNWVTLTGAAAAQTPAMARTSFRQVVAPGDTLVSTARVTCTDALGTPATHDITITMTNEGEF